jgi:hypothetical protein
MMLDVGRFGPPATTGGCAYFSLYPLAFILFIQAATKL